MLYFGTIILYFQKLKIGFINSPVIWELIYICRTASHSIINPYTRQWAHVYNYWNTASIGPCCTTRKYCWETEGIRLRPRRQGEPAAKGQKIGSSMNYVSLTNLILYNCQDIEHESNVQKKKEMFFDHHISGHLDGNNMISDPEYVNLYANLAVRLVIF